MSSTIPNPFVIGISGPAESGKDTFAKLLMGAIDRQLSEPSIPYEHRTVSFADPVKEVCGFIFDSDVKEDFNTSEGKRRIAKNGYGKTNRELLQIVGTDMFRDMVDTNIWLDIAARRMNRTGLEYVIIPDTRFPNEGKWVKDNGLYIHVNPSYPGYKGIVETGHASEKGTGVQPHITVENSRGLDQLKYVAECIANIVRQALISKQGRLANINSTSLGFKQGEHLTYPEKQYEPTPHRTTD